MLLQPDQRPAELQNPATLGDLEARWRPQGGFVVPDFGFAVRDPVAAAQAGEPAQALPGGGSGGLTAADFTSGQIPASRLDDIDKRILYAIFDSGVFDHPLPRDAFDRGLNACPPAGGGAGGRGGHGAAERRVAAAPLSGKVHSIAVISPSGSDAVFDRRVRGGSAGRRTGGHAAGRYHRARRLRARHPGNHLGAGVGGRRGRADAGAFLGADPTAAAPARGCSALTGATATSAEPRC